MSFHENLKALRVAASVTQKQMAEYLGISDRGYRNYELGRNEPSISDLIKIADLFKVSLDVLVGRNLSELTLMNSEDVL